MKFYTFSDDPIKAQQFIQEIKDLHKAKYKDLNCLVVSDEATWAYNNDNEAIKRCEKALKKFKEDKMLDKKKVVNQVQPQVQYPVQPQVPQYIPSQYKVWYKSFSTNTEDGYSKLIKNHIRLDPKPSNEKFFKWPNEIYKTGVASCSEFAASIALDYIENGYEAVLGSIGFHSLDKNYSRSHIICLVKIGNNIVVKNYIDNGEYDSRVYHTTEFTSAIDKYMDYFVPIMQNHFGVKKGMKEHYLISSPELTKHVLLHYKDKQITQKNILKKLNIDYSSRR